MKKYFSFCLKPKNILISFRYISLTFVIAFGLTAIVATGGGDDNNETMFAIVDTSEEDDNNETVSDPCDYNADIICGDDEWKWCQANTGNPANFTILNDKLIFTAFSGCKNNVSTVLFELDSTGEVNEVYEIGSYDLDDQDPTFSSPRNVRSMVTINNVAYFTWMSNLYEYDGVNPVQIIKEGVIPNSLMAYNDKLYYTTYDPNSGPPGMGQDFNSLLYSYDGSTQVLIGEIDGYPGSYTIYNGKLYFFINDEDLWCYNEYTDELSLVSDMEDDFIRYPGNFIIFQDKLYFSAGDGDHGNQLWMIDTENNVSMITSLAKINTYLDSFDGPLAVFQGKLLCLVYESEDVKRLWAYDGYDINPIPVDAPYSYVTDNFILNNRFYFLGPESSGELIDLAVLWAYDGLNAPFKIEASEYLRDIFPYDGKLLLRTEQRLLVYDGQSQPEAFADLGDPVLDSVNTLTSFNGYYYITGDSVEYGFELWKIDESETITLVKDFYPGIACNCEND